MTVDNNPEIPNWINCLRDWGITGKRANILIMLMNNPGHPVTQDKIRDLFFPNTPTKTANNIIEPRLYNINQRLNVISMASIKLSYAARVGWYILPIHSNRLITLGNLWDKRLIRRKNNGDNAAARQ